jgi:hypothetical protein
MNIENLEKLARFLLALPSDYQHFAMDSYFRIDSAAYRRAPKEDNPANCGAVACAIGHAVTAGLPMTEDESFYHYSLRVFGLDAEDDEHIWDWCFDPDWQHFDNTPAGAADRILYAIDNEIPTEFFVSASSEIDTSEYTGHSKIYKWRTV